ncbi:MAG TPA: hypothetical protein VEC12_04500 [Bacteroidia bacterium]|nr:hypothetical protein [Bacteroidia bacterium]
MNALLAALVLMWIAVLVGTAQRIFQMPQWFADPPASFELIRRQSKAARLFWIPLSVLFVLCASIALIDIWEQTTARNYVLMALAAYALAGVLSAMYFVKEIIAFSKMPPDGPKTGELLWRTRTWLRWTTVRNVFHWFAAIFLTLAYRALE